jgi:mono/diheme cytochrome c family protein
VVLLSVGLLTALPPARTTATVSALRASANVDDLTMAVSIEPGKVGLNTFSLQVTSGGRPMAGAKEVALRFTPTIANLAPSQAELTDNGNGLYTARGAYLSLPDNWQVQAVVRRDSKFDAFANFTFPLGAAAAAAFPWHRLSGGLLLIGAVLIFFALARIPLGARRVPRLGNWLPPIALCAVGLVVYYQSPAAPNSGPVNPIPPNADSVARGQALYLANCLPCHGPAGKGDGPVGLTLNPRPADLSAHAVPGVHTDGQLYTWITDGFPGSVMPAFKSVLTDDNRWDLVNYVRTLAPK